MVSKVKKMVMRPPTMLRAPKILKCQRMKSVLLFSKELVANWEETDHKTLAVPILVWMTLKTRAAMTAPTLPQAAEKPLANPRTRVGYDSEATMKVVVFALEKREHCQKRCKSI